MSRTSLAYLALVITTVAGPIVFVALRYTLACPFLLALTLQQNRKRNSGNLRKNWKILLVAGLSGPFISQIMQYIGLQMTTASDALLLLNLTPIFAVLLAAPILKERITLDKFIGLLIATVGVTFIVLNTSPAITTINLQRILGDIIVIASTFFFAINGIAGKIAVKYENAVTVTFYSTLFAVPFIWISAAIFEDVTVLFRMSSFTWLVIAWIAIVNTVMAFILYYESMKYIEASRVQITLNLIAVWGVLMSVLILHETITLLQIIGGFLTIVGVILAQMTQIRKKSNEALISPDETTESD